MATAAEKKTITKKLLQELRNRCRDHYNVVADGTMPEAVDVRETNQKLEELVLPVSYTHLTLPTILLV